MNSYNKDYFENGLAKGISCYENYRWIPELTIPMAYNIIRYLGLKDGQTVLDYGCAKGYVVYALRLLGINAFGFDISDYAISQAPIAVKDFVSTSLKNKEYDWIISKDVFEHLNHHDLAATLHYTFSATNNLFVIVPLAKDKKYVVPQYELDQTHFQRLNVEEWETLFRFVGWKSVEFTDRVPGIKDNYAEYEGGNGFFKLQKNI